LNNGQINRLWKSCVDLEWPFGPFMKLLFLTGERWKEVSRINVLQLSYSSPIGQCRKIRLRYLLIFNGGKSAMTKRKQTEP
jgi:hypothetical protein